MQLQQCRILTAQCLGIVAVDVQAKSIATPSEPDGNQDSDDDELFKSNATPSQKPGQDTAEAIDALDSCLALNLDQVGATWSASAAVESLRNRFVTGKGSCQASVNDISGGFLGVIRGILTLSNAALMQALLGLLLAFKKQLSMQRTSESCSLAE